MQRSIEGVRKGQRSQFPLFSFYWLLEPFALRAKANLDKNTYRLFLERLVRPKQLIHTNWRQKAFRTPSKRRNLLGSRQWRLPRGTEVCLSRHSHVPG